MSLRRAKYRVEGSKRTKKNISKDEERGIKGNKIKYTRHKREATDQGKYFSIQSSHQTNTFTNTEMIWEIKKF